MALLWLVGCGGGPAESTDTTQTTGATGSTGSTSTDTTATDITGTEPTTDTPTTMVSGTTESMTTQAETSETSSTSTGDTGDTSTGTSTGDPIDPPASLEDIVDGELEQIADGHMFTEGPVWSPEGYLLYSDIPANTIFRWVEGNGSEAFITPSGNSNGLTFDAMGQLLAAEHGNRRISRRTVGEDAETVVDQYMGQKLNSPNDLIQRADGTIYFTDPPYGIQPNQQELDFQGVFRVDPLGELSLIADDFDRPNGIVLSPDETRLYVADTQKEHVRVFAVAADSSTSGGEVFIDLQTDLQGNPDGMAVDQFGDLFVTGGGGVRVVSPAGVLLGTIEVPEQVTNCSFGDPDGQSLFLTAQAKVYRIRLKVKGA